MFHVGCIPASGEVLFRVYLGEQLAIVGVNEAIFQLLKRTTMSLWVLCVLPDRKNEIEDNQMRTLVHREREE